MIEIYKLINDKDIFMSSFQKSIARRLINNNSYSIQFEKLFVDMLRQESGGTYTSKLDKMFEDL